MSRPPQPPPPLGLHRSGTLSRQRARPLAWLLDCLFHLMVRVWAVVILGGLAASAMLSLIQNGPSGLADPNKYLLVYVLSLLVFANPVVSLATIGTLLLLTALGTIAHVTSSSVH